jgi:WD40 repeat protein
MLAVGGDDNIIYLYNAKTGASIRNLFGHTNIVTGLSFTPDNKKLVSASFDKTARLWDVTSGSELTQYLTSDGIDCMALSKDGKKLLTGGFDGYLKMWDIETGVDLLQIEMPVNRLAQNERESIRSVVFLPDGQSAITGNSNSVHSWNLQTGNEIRKFHSTDHDCPDVCIAWVKSVSVSADGSRLAAASTIGEGFIFVWETQTGKQIALIHRHSHIYKNYVGHLNSLILSPDGTKILAGFSEDIRAWDISSTKEIYRSHIKNSGSVQALALSPDLRSIAIVEGFGLTQIWTAGDIFIK